MKSLIWIVPAAAAVFALAIWLNAGQHVPAAPPGNRVSDSTVLSRSASSASPSAPSSTPTVITQEPEAASATAEDQAKIRILDQILASKNDNDPRLDQDFNQLSSAAKALMRQRYRAIAPEERNQRGTVIFLLGRNLTTSADFDFLRSVVDEPACLSLSDCSSEPKNARPSHLDGVEQVTLAYPSLVALKSVEAFLSAASKNRPDPRLLTAAYQVLAEARRSSVPRVVALALEISSRYPNPRG